MQAIYLSAAHPKEYDFTHDKLYTLSDQTTGQLQRFE